MAGLVDVREILKKYWGYPAFRPLQEDIIQSILSGKDTLALLPTGGGKSICFQVPALAKEGVCLVITPLIALMKDQVAQLKRRQIPAAAIFSGMSRREIDITLDNCVYGNVKFLYLSPERIQTEIFQERVKKMKICLLAVDEAHCISQWGYDFRPSYLTIATLREILPEVPVMALTASATEVVQKDVMEKLLFKNPQVFQKSFARANLSYSVFRVEDKEKKVLEILKNVPGSSIIYVRSRKKTQDVAAFLRRNRISSDFYHAGLPGQERSLKQDAWIAGTTRVIVATNAFGMGIDKPDVRTVIHWEMPESMEAYYQEAGRAGRDEKKAFGILLYHDKDITLLEKKFEETYPSVDFLKKVYQSLANFYKIAVGSSNLISYDFDLVEFEKAYKLPKTETYYALKRLEGEGIIQLNEGFYQPGRIMFLLDHKALYEFQIANEKFDSLVKALLRMYGGELFTSFCIIQERQLAAHLNKPEFEVKQLMKLLDKMEVLEYQEQKDKPQIVFTIPRQDASKLPVNSKELERRRDNDYFKMRAMIHYATQEVKCRTLAILEYFGEVSDEDCGVCDICLRKKREKKDDSRQDEIRKFLLSQVEKNPIHPEALAELVVPSERENAVKAIRLMLDCEEIFIDQDGLLQRKK